MGHELSRDVIRASELVRELQLSEAELRESEARMSLAVDAGDFGIWIRDLTRNEIWASEKWRELYGFTPTEPVEFDAILKCLHPDNRETLLQAHRAAMAGSSEGRFQVEYRVVLPDGGTRWISSRGRVERDGSNQSVLIRGASRDVTARKHAELALHDLSGRLLSAQEEERRRIARELHDNLSQQMAALAIGISQVVRKVGMASEPVAKLLRDLGQRTAEISEEIHGLSHRLHSSKLASLGLVEALHGHCQEVTTHSVDVRFDHRNVPRALPHDVETCLFRVVQEGLNNVVKHSGARLAEVTLRATGDVLILSIADSGRGFDDAPDMNRDGVGLASMRERLRLVHGDFTVRSQPGQGTMLIARVQLAATDGVTVVQSA